MKTFITGHKSPDTDSIASSLVMADLEKKLGNTNEIISCRLGELNKETEYALNYFKVEAPTLINSVKDADEVILVDHNSFSQNVEDISSAKIVKVVDHHCISNFKTAEPLFYYAQPVGCTCTILYELYKTNNFEITSTIAGLMLSAIISDTLLLKSPTCTSKDVRAVEELSKISNVDYNIYGLNMLKAGTDLSSYSSEELINLDSKEFSSNGYKFQIAQVNTVDIDDVLKNQSTLETAMNDFINTNKLDLFMFIITDIINSNSKAIVLGTKSSVIEKSYNTSIENNIAFLPGVVSRKKQVVPVITTNI
jgi:manganese-dependent inorganic pyrophosphatase